MMRSTSVLCWPDQDLLEPRPRTREHPLPFNPKKIFEELGWPSSSSSKYGLCGIQSLGLSAFNDPTAEVEVEFMVKRIHASVRGTP
jgi:hypothetical protein